MTCIDCKDCAFYSNKDKCQLIGDSMLNTKHCKYKEKV